MTVDTPPAAPRDYRITGPENARAVERGLASADWYRSPVPRARMKELMRRSDAPALWHTVLWLGLLAGTGWLAHLAWGTWWAVPAFAAYGVLYGSVADSRWHECGHGTAFKTPWMNTVVYELASFMALREAVSWRWSHVRHHSDTIVVGRDVEIAVPRPTPIWKLVLELFAIRSVAAELRKIATNVVGRLTADEREYVPATQHRRAIRTSRIYAAILLAVVAWSVAIGSIEPLMFIGLPTLYGRWLAFLFGVTQHAGLEEDVLDHRRNCRTVMMNPVFRYLYWNMNYHVEHHMFPSVPFHALPALHAEVRDDMPPPYTSVLDAYREIAPTLWRQARDPSYFVVRPVPGAEAAS